MELHHDLTSPEGVQNYLRTHGYSSRGSVERLAGGSSGFVYRARFDEANDRGQLSRMDVESL
jgi:hypothetical protein